MLVILLMITLNVDHPVFVFSALTRAMGGRRHLQPAGTRLRLKSLSTLTLVPPEGILTSTSKIWNLRIPWVWRLLTSLRVLWI